MANDIKKFMKKAVAEVIKDLQKEIDELMPNKEIPLKKEPGLLKEMIYDIVGPTFNDLDKTVGAAAQGPINRNNVWIKIDKNKMRQFGVNMETEFLINVFSKDEENDKKIRLGFYGGEAKDKEGEVLVISPLPNITESITAQENAKKLQIIFTEKLSTKAKKIAMELEIKEKGNK